MLACAGLQLLALRDVWLAESYTPGLIRPAHFEQADGEAGADGVEVAIGPRLWTYMLPDVTLNDDGSFLVPTGRALVFPRPSDGAYAIQTLDSGEPPYVVLAAESASGDASDPPRLVGARVLDVSAGRPAWREWDPAAPWKEDRAWRGRLHEACADGGEVVLDGRELHLGRCALPLPPVIEKSRPIVAVLSAADWLRVERRPEPWSYARRLQPEALPIVVLAILGYLAVWWPVSPPTGLALCLLLVGISLGFPTETLLGWLLAMLAGLAGLCWLGLRWCLRRGRRLAVVAAAIAAVAALTWGDEPLESDRCILTGYSTAKGVGLREGVAGLLEHLDRDCEPCAGHTVCHARSGWTFAQLGRWFCGDLSPVQPGGKVLFLGGANDDFLWSWAMDADLNVYRFLHGSLARERVKRTAEYPRESMPQSAEASFALLDDQRAALRSTLECIDARGGEFFYFHDFIVSDLASGRSAERREMLDARRAEVEAAGGTFVDLLEEFGDVAGVSWFSDFIHFSDVAHRRTSARMCEVVRGSRAPGAEARTR